MLESKPTPVSFLGLHMYLSTVRHSLGRLERVSRGPMSSAAESGSMLSPAHYYVDTLAHPSCCVAATRNADAHCKQPAHPSLSSLPSPSSRLP